MLQSLLLVVVGGLLGVGGTIAGQYLQARNASRRREEDFAREDRYRLFRDRLEAYREFHIAAGHARRAMFRYSSVRDDPLAHHELVEARQDFGRLTHLYG